MTQPLEGRAALVTGVSRRRGIGFAVASRLAEMGASLVVHHHLAHDASEYGETEDLDDLVADLRTRLSDGATIVDLDCDLGDATTAATLVRWRIIRSSRAIASRSISLCITIKNGSKF